MNALSKLRRHFSYSVSVPVINKSVLRRGDANHLYFDSVFKLQLTIFITLYTFFIVGPIGLVLICETVKIGIAEVMWLWVNCRI